ncbi:MAG: SDR family oxidoreductase [Oligoflexales bacterium]|nr:SDR family oxidoreductase [Oligoflexales bacterium]
MADHVAFVTGASRGIGSEMARSLARSGYDVALFSRNGELLGKLALEITSIGRRALVLPGDVRMLDDLRKAVEKCEAELGAVDLVVAAAGVLYDNPIESFDPIRSREIYEVNMIGMMQTIASVLPSMLKRRKGTVVGISSLASYIELPRIYCYSASKAAVRFYLEGLREDVAPYGIRVFSVFPGFVRTDILENVPGIKDPRFPFRILSPGEAVGIIRKKMNKGVENIRFPLYMYFLIKLSYLYPKSLALWITGLFGYPPRGSGKDMKK